MIAIREMTPADCGQVYQLFEQCFHTPWSLKSIEDMCDHTGYYHLIAHEDGRVVGYVGILKAAGEADITNVAVSPDFRRRHIARDLIHALQKKAGEDGITQIYLEVRAGNQPAIGLYEKAGFARVGVRKNYYRNPPEDALIMCW